MDQNGSEGPAAPLIAQAARGSSEGSGKHLSNGFLLCFTTASSEPSLNNIPLIWMVSGGTRTGQSAVLLSKTCVGRTSAVISRQTAALFCPPSCRQSQPPKKRDNYTRNEVCRKIKTDPGPAEKWGVKCAVRFMKLDRGSRGN